MRTTRRRFLTIAAAFVSSPALAQPHTWQGMGFGAEINISLSGPADAVESALDAATRLLAQAERVFSLYDPASEVSRLNAGGLLRPHPWLYEVLVASDRAYHLTEGLFDPTVQPLWRALASGSDPVAARRLIGWDKVAFDTDHVRLGPGQAVTFNGIAQGFATDLVSAMLAERGFDRTLVNIGEFRGQGGPWRLDLQDPRHGHLGRRTFSDSAIATSSPMSTPIGPTGHILAKAAQPRWSTVSVEAESAMMADALSTGLVLGGLDLARKLRAARGVRRITLVDDAGDLTTL